MHTPSNQPSSGAGASSSSTPLARSLTLPGPSPDDCGYYVLRDRAALTRLARFISDEQPFRRLGLGPVQPAHSHAHLHSLPLPPDVLELAGAHLHAMVPVRLRLDGRGVPSSFAHICVPLASDLRAYSCQHFAADDTRVRVTEEEQAVVSQAESELLEPRAASCASLFLKPPDSSSPIASSSRPLIGYVLAGDYSLVEAHGLALGFVSLVGLLQIASSQSAHCLTCTCAAASPSPSSNDPEPDRAAGVQVRHSLMLREAFESTSASSSAASSCSSPSQSRASFSDAVSRCRAPAAGAHERQRQSQMGADSIPSCCCCRRRCAVRSPGSGTSGLVSLVRNHSSRRYMYARVSVLENAMCAP